MKTTISNSDDLINSRDVIARIEELQDERTALTETLDEAIDADNESKDTERDEAMAEALKEARDALKDWDSDNGDEFKSLKDLAEEAEGYADWVHGETLIRRSYFIDYVIDLLEDIGDLPKNLPSYIEIDWDATARNIEQDYTSVDFDGVEYLIR